MCPVCGATIGRPEYDGHDCAAGMVLWKYPATAIKELRQLGVPVPNELGFDAYDDRLFILDHDRELNGNFLGLGDSPAILKALLEILVDGLGDPKMKTDSERPIAEGGNRPDNPKVGQRVPRGTFEGEDHLILRTRQIREHFVDNEENGRKLRDALGDASPAPQPPRPRIIDANRAQPDQVMNNGSPTRQEPLTLHNSQWVVGDSLRHGAYGEGKIVMVDESGVTLEFNRRIGAVHYPWPLFNTLSHGNVVNRVRRTG